MTKSYLRKKESWLPDLGVQTSGPTHGPGPHKVTTVRLRSEIRWLLSQEPESEEQ